MVPVEKRDAATLIPIIKEWILPGATIVSDFWKAYDSLTAEGYDHLKVNHSINFVYELTGAHSNTIELSWRHVKAVLPGYRRHKPFMGGYLAKYMFLKKIRFCGVDPTYEFFKSVGDFWNTSPQDKNEEEADVEPEKEEEEDLDDDAFLPPDVN